MENQKYVNVNKKYFADALNFLGFHYFKFQNDGKTVYSFENTDKFKKAIQGLLQLRDKLND